MDLAFFEAANGWYDFKDYNPFRLRRSAGVGMRFFLPMFGLLGFDYGIGIDSLWTQCQASKMHHVYLYAWAMNQNKLLLTKGPVPDHTCLQFYSS